MDVRDYCSNMAAELNGWKAKMYDVTRKLDKLSSGDKEKVVHEINELHIIIEELNDRIDKLNRACPTEWAPDKDALDGKFNYMKNKLKTVWDQVSPGDIGG
ncbi:MAG: hypothetical protein ABIJ37_00625 [Pseudomonadota bacterium]